MLRRLAACAAFVSIVLCGPAYATSATENELVLREGQVLVLRGGTQKKQPVVFRITCHRVGLQFEVKVPQKGNSVYVICPSPTDCEVSAARDRRQLPIPLLTGPVSCFKEWQPKLVPIESILPHMDRIEVEI